jgi:hypothetical protein
MSMCKKILFAVMLAAGLIVALTATAVAQENDASLDKMGAMATFTSPNTIMYQGRLTTAAGAPITDTVTVAFGIYAAYSGGSPLWQGAWQLNPDDNGIFSQEIGTIPDTVFTGAVRYMQITVRGEAMTPRQTLTSAPYAFAADPSPTPANYGFQFVTYKGSGTTPIALGFISSSGAVQSGTGNFSCAWNASLNRYEITITGESYYYTSYTTIVTPSGSGSAFPYMCFTGSVSGMLIVYFYKM